VVILTRLQHTIKKQLITFVSQLWLSLAESCLYNGVRAEG